MTSAQLACLTFIRDYLVAHHRVSPSLAEISAGIQTATKSSVQRLVACLVRDGYLTHKPRTKRSILLTRKGEEVFIGSEYDRGWMAGYRAALADTVKLPLTRSRALSSSPKGAVLSRPVDMPPAARTALFSSSP